MIEIQCPDCGTILKMNEEKEYFCDDCDRILFESQIRERCAL